MLAAKATPALKGRHAVRALRRQAGTAVGVGAVAVTLTALSLNHLAHGIEVVTRCQPWEGWAMAVGIDLGFVALAQLAIGDKLRERVARLSRPAIVGTLIGSAGMNAFAFGAQTTNYWMLAAAITLGVAILALVYALTRTGAAIYVDVNSRTA